MQHTDQNVLFPLPDNRWERYCFIKSDLGRKSSSKVFPIGKIHQENSQSRQMEEGIYSETVSTRFGSTAGGQQFIQFIGGLEKNKKRLENGKNYSRNFSQGERIYSEEGLAPTLSSQSGGTAGVGNALVHVGTINRGEFQQRQDEALSLDANYYKGLDNHGARTAILSHYGHKNKPPVESDISPTLKAQSHGHEPMVAQRIPLKFLNRNQKNIEGDYAFTVDGANTGGIMVSKTVRSGGRSSPPDAKQNWDSYEIGGRIRRFTPMECERLQSFPDGWTEGISDTQRYKCLGNAVTVNVISAIIERMFPK